MTKFLLINLYLGNTKYISSKVSLLLSNKLYANLWLQKGEMICAKKKKNPFAFILKSRAHYEQLFPK